MATLRKPQKKAVKFIKKKKRCALFMKMGAGKTLASLTAIQELIDKQKVKRVLVIGPLRVMSTTWPDEVDKWEHLKHLTFAKAIGTPAKRSQAVQADTNLTFINFENVEWLVTHHGKDWPFDMVVVDESSGFKSHKSRRFKALRKVAHKSKYFVLLTGTPSPNGLSNLWSQMFLLDQGERLGKNMTLFRNRYFNKAGYMGYQYELKEGADHKIHAAIEDLVLAIDPGFEELSTVSINLPCVLPSGLTSKYKALKKKMVMDVQESEIIVESAAALSNKLLQFANGAVYDEEKNVHEIHSIKLKALKDLIEDNPNENILLAYNFIFDKNKIVNEFPDAVILNENPDTIKAWNDKKIPLLIANPKSAGHGLNLQFGGSIIVWFGLTWDLELYQQFNARLPRPGQTEPVRIFHLVMQDTIDTLILEALKDKGLTQKALFTYLLKNL